MKQQHVIRHWLRRNRLRCLSMRKQVRKTTGAEAAILRKEADLDLAKAKFVVYHIDPL